jgi:hypothetical protein
MHFESNNQLCSRSYAVYWRSNGRDLTLAIIILDIK